MKTRFPLTLLTVSVLLLIGGCIMYVHVPTAWCAMLLLTWAFACAVAFHITGRAWFGGQISEELYAKSAK